MNGKVIRNWHSPFLSYCLSIRCDLNSEDHWKWMENKKIKLKNSISPNPTMFIIPMIFPMQSIRYCYQMHLNSPNNFTKYPHIFAVDRETCKLIVSVISYHHRYYCIVINLLWLPYQDQVDLAWHCFRMFSALSTQRVNIFHHYIEIALNHRTTGPHAVCQMGIIQHQLNFIESVCVGICNRAHCFREELTVFVSNFSVSVARVLCSVFQIVVFKRCIQALNFFEIFRGLFWVLWSKTKKYLFADVLNRFIRHHFHPTTNSIENSEKFDA